MASITITTAENETVAIAYSNGEMQVVNPSTSADFGVPESGMEITVAAVAEGEW